MSQESRNELPHLDESPQDGAEDRLKGALASAVGAVFQSGNSVEVLKNGREIFPSMLEAIRNAENTIDFVTFVYWQGQIARDFANALADKSKEGVRVRVVLDAFGSSPMKESLIETMTGAGVAVERFRPIVRWKFWESDHRTHRKILVVDDRIGFTGGVGIASEWEGDARNPDEWRETHMRVEGPIVLSLKAAFLADWRDTGHVIDLTDARVERPEEAGDIDIAMIDGSAHIGLNDAERALETLVAAADQRIVLQTPYFNPEEGLLELLHAALARGVEVDLLVPGPHIDKRISDVMAEEMYLPLLERGARVWRFQPTMMHTKAVLVDGVISMVGSINLNRRSIEKDEEAAIAIADREITATLEDHFREDVQRSVPAVAAQEERPWQRKVAAKVLRPMKGEL